MGRFPKYDRYHVLGIDPSLSNTGVALMLVDNAIELVRLERVQTKPDGNMPVFRQMKVATRLTRALLGDELGVPLIVCVEAPSYGAMRSETMHALFALVIRMVIDLKPFLIVTPTPSHLKMFSRSLQTIFGVEEENLKTASKSTFSAVFPGHRPSGRVLTDDEAEAGLLALLAHRFYGVATEKVSLSGMSRLERETFVSQKSTKKAERKGILYREGEFFFLPKILGGTKVRDFSREQNTHAVLGVTW